MENLNEKKQIEEMAKVISNIPQIEFPFGSRLQGRRIYTSTKIAEHLYNENYRKQSEGEWKKLYDKAPRYVCTICSHLFNNKEYKYCPNCGARMSGGKNE